MKYTEDIKKKVADAMSYFRDNRATLTRHGPFEVLDWRRPDTVVCSVRIVFDIGYPNAAYITGDLGEAIIRPTCEASLASMASCFTRRGENGDLEVNCGYFMEKIETASDRYEWSREAFVEDFKGRCAEHGLTPPEDFLDELDDYLSPVEFFDDKPPVLSGDAQRDLEEMDRDYWEWIYDCGKRVGAQVIAWLVALRLAYEQVARAQTAGKRMTHKEIQGVLSDAHHEICHAYAFVGTPSRELSALQAIDRARDGLNLAYDALNTLEDDALAARRER